MPQHAVRHRTGRVFRIVFCSILAVVLFSGSAVAAQIIVFQQRLQGTGDFTGLVSRPTADPTDSMAGQALNILVLGSDDRSGENGEIGGVESGMRSDTTIIAHISADRTRVDLISIGRDTMIKLPACNLTTTPNEKMTKPYTAKFNEAYSVGNRANSGDPLTDILIGASCTVETIYQNTGLVIDDFVVVDFAGFQKMVDAIGGIDINVPERVNDTKYTRLVLEAGETHMDGALALQYARVRHGVGDGSDTQRMPRQQAVIAAIISKAMSGETVTNPIAMRNFIGSSIESLTLSPGLDSVGELVGLGWSLRSIDTSKITFVTVDASQTTSSGAWSAAATALWPKIIADQTVADSTLAAPFDLRSGAASDATTGTN